MSEAKLTVSRDVIDPGSSLSPLCEIITDKLGTTPVLSTEGTFGLDLNYLLKEPTSESQACGEDQWGQRSSSPLKREDKPSIVTTNQGNQDQSY